MVAVKPKLLFLDDRSKRIHAAIELYSPMFAVTIVTNVTECLRLMANEEWHAWSLDHDLSGQEFMDPDSKYSGMEIVRYLEKTAWPKEKRKPNILIHSSNVFAATLMEKRLKAMGFSVCRQRFQYA